MDDFLQSDAAWRRFLFNLEDYAIVILDFEGNIVDWNEGAKALKGYSAHEIIDRHFSTFYTPEAVSMGHPERELAIAGSTGRYEEEGWRVRKDGSRFWAHVVINAIRDETGAVRGFGKVVRDVTERKQAAEQTENILKLLEISARTDYLTGLDNRRSFDTHLIKLMSAARRHPRSFCIAMIDLDLFKQFNDSFGHQAGDNILKKSALAWRNALRTNDLIARYGGEEFVIVMPETEIAAAVLALERLRSMTPSPLTCSVGLAQWDLEESADELLGRADHLLYVAKDNGRNRIAM